MKDWWQVNFPQGRQSLTITDAQGHPVKIAYGEKGTGRPLILLHGIGSWSYNWRYSIEPLSKYFRVICFDAKGYGFSEKPLSRREQSGHQVIELERIIQALCDQPAIVAAESLGALASLALAIKNPELIGRLVVINVPIFAEYLPNWAMELAAQIPLEIVYAIDSLRLAHFFAPFVREFVAMERRKVLSDPSALTQEDVYWMTYPFIELPGTLVKAVEELKIAAKEIDNLQGKQPNILNQIQSNLHTINCPTLILWGEQDSWFSVSQGYKLHQYLPNSRLQIIQNCGHDASTSSFKVINAAIIEFLQDTDFC
jgi:pimeloyl-ACP methyl ester carboxylesterase